MLKKHYYRIGKNVIMIILILDKIFSALFYMLPWSEAIHFGTNLLSQYTFAKILIIPTIPLILIKQYLPFGELILFLLLFIGVVRNEKIKYFLRFNCLQAILLNIAILLVNYLYQIMLNIFGSNLMTQSLSGTVFISVLTLIIFCIYECFQGNEAEIPGISNATRMQL